MLLQHRKWNLDKLHEQVKFINNMTDDVTTDPSATGKAICNRVGYNKIIQQVLNQRIVSKIFIL